MVGDQCLGGWVCLCEDQARGADKTRERRRREGREENNEGGGLVMAVSVAWPTLAQCTTATAATTTATEKGKGIGGEKEGRETMF